MARLSLPFVAFLLACSSAFAAGDSPAHATAKRLMRGVNLGNALEAPPGQDWGARYSEKDFEAIRAQGFDHVRLPVAWHHYAGPAPDYALSPAIFAKVDALLASAARKKLAVIVDLHHFDAFTSAPAANKAELLALWKQIAAHYAGAPRDTVFEILNEPKDAATTEVMSEVYPEVIAVIRKTNPDRTILVGPGKWNGIGELAKLKLPDAERNLVVTVHSYEPFYFSHQGATWAGDEVKALKGIVFPGPPATPFVPPADAKLPAWELAWIKDYNTQPEAKNPSGPATVRKAVETARRWAATHDRPVHVGEFGAYVGADNASRVRFYRTYREALDKAGIGWAIWDWKAGFRYWDEKAGAPVPGMREALFPAR